MAVCQYSYTLKGKDKQSIMIWRLREKLARFMQGRNGSDEFTRFLMWVCVAVLVLSLIPYLNFLYLAALALLIYMYFRMFSKNTNKRQRENQWYLNKRYAFYAWKDKKKSRAAQSRTHRFYKCKGCGQTIRVPRGKGKIEITCPKCKYKFIKKT